jgi:hypothetical protein
MLIELYYEKYTFAILCIPVQHFIVETSCQKVLSIVRKLNISQSFGVTEVSMCTGFIFRNIE